MAVILLLATWFSWNGGSDESLPDLPRDNAGVGSGEMPRLSSMEGEPYSIIVFGLAADGPSAWVHGEPANPNASPTPGTPEPTVVVVPAGTPIPVCEWECILRTVGWPDSEIQNALSVSWCESRWQDVQNYGGGPYYGRFQIAFTSAGYHQDKLRQLGYPVEVASLYDPYINAHVALLIWQQSGWAAWECKP